MFPGAKSASDFEKLWKTLYLPFFISVFKRCFQGLKMFLIKFIALKCTLKSLRRLKNE